MEILIFLSLHGVEVGTPFFLSVYLVSVPKRYYHMDRGVHPRFGRVVMASPVFIKVQVAILVLLGNGRGRLEWPPPSEKAWGAHLSQLYVVINLSHST